jgi:hypothetical protein
MKKICESNIIPECCIAIFENGSNFEVRVITGNCSYFVGGNIPNINKAYSLWRKELKKLAM